MSGLFRNTSEVEIGSVVVDDVDGVPRKALRIVGGTVELERPSGALMRVNHRRLRPAGPIEIRQYNALRELGQRPRRR